MSNPNNPLKITITPNGPYLVTGNVPLTERYTAESVHGEALAWDPVGADEFQQPAAEKYALCRCGQSSNKPYCDGTHSKVGFVGTVTADPAPSAERRQTYVGDGIVMTDEPGLCAHAGFCGTRFTDAWEMIKRTNNPEVRERLRQMAGNCPSGRIQVTMAGNDQPDEPAYTPSIATTVDGPLWVRGGIEVQTMDGVSYEVRNRVTLCRCGQSKNKPFCDGSHWDAGFKAPKRAE